MTSEIMKDAGTVITFCVNGKQYKVGNEYPATTSLLDFLRKSGTSTGTKGCCLEGGCGACLVTVKFQDPLSNKAKSYSITSCCLQLYSCDGLDITTVEGLGNTKSGLHPIQDRLAVFDGSQCGFCSPGQVMNMYGLLKNNARPKMKEVEDAFDTNICRCTVWQLEYPDILQCYASGVLPMAELIVMGQIKKGHPSPPGYRSILDAMKSFAIDAPTSSNGGVIDIEELDGKVCCRVGQPCSNICQDIDRPLQIITDQSQWYRPVNLPQLSKLLLQFAKEKYRLVCGNTGFGIFRELAVINYKILIDIRGVKELYAIDLDEQFHISLGANLTLTNLKELFESINDPGVPYAKEFAAHLQYVASTGVRNLGSWAGNLMLKHLHQEFPSDVFTILETVGTSINIVDEKGRNKNYSLLDFLSLNMNGKVIVSMQLPKYRSKDITIRTFRTSQRLQLSSAYVVSGFNFQISINKDYLIETRPTIIIQGISTTLVHASQTEAFLINKNLSDPNALKDAIRILSTEVKSGFENPLVASLSYRISLAIGHFYKFILGICKDKSDVRFVSGGLDLERPVMSATHDYGTLNPATFPVSKPLMKLTAKNQTTGEVKYVNDRPPVQGQLNAAAVLSTKGNAKIERIDPTSALKMPGVVAFIQASDIPGQNNWKPTGSFGDAKLELLSSGTVEYAGQPIGVIVAEDETIALEAVKAVKVRYTDIKPVIVDLLDAIQQRSFLNKLGPYTKGNAQAALESAPHRVKGTAQVHEQYHFHLENQATICTPTDIGGMDVYTTTQWIDGTQETVAQVLGIPVASVKLEIQRLGGGFGGKIFYNFPVAGMAAVAAHKVQKTVKLNMNLQTNMQFQGQRMGYFYEYEVGFDNDGKLLAIIATGYSDCGVAFNPLESNEKTNFYIDSGYFCPNWSWTVQSCKTNKPMPTPIRSQGSGPSIYAMESMIDHVATYLKKDHLDVRKINLYINGQTTLTGLVLKNTLARETVQELERDINYPERKQLVEDYNKANRWRKRGLQVMPCRYEMAYTSIKFNTSVIVYHGDGTVLIAHGAIDLGQGINTKAIQTCAYKLGISIDKIKVATSSSVINANSGFTGGTTSTDLVCDAVIKCCDELSERMAASRKSLTNPTWEQVVAKSFLDGVNLSVQYWPKAPIDSYSSYTACCSEVELDILTGQYQIIQVDYVYDCGISLNPELDLGQLEGAFNMGCGLFLLENTIVDPQTGKLLTDGTNTYKPPLAKDLPFKLNIKFLRNAPNPSGVLSSKSVGETPVGIGTCPMLALKRAIEAARAETGVEGWFPFYAPATVEKIQQACLNDVSKYTLGEDVSVTDSSGCISQ